jgi:hypothetical protein
MEKKAMLDLLISNLNKMFEAHKARVSTAYTGNESVIRLSNGLYYSRNSDQAVSILKADVFSHFRAAELCGDVRDGAGNIGEAVGMRRALAEDITRQLDLIEMLYASGVVTTKESV